MPGGMIFVDESDDIQQISRNYQGIEIIVEYPAGSEIEGVTPTGEFFDVDLPFDCGVIADTISLIGEMKPMVACVNFDVLSDMVFFTMINDNQNNPIMEKVWLGYTTVDEVQAAADRVLQGKMQIQTPYAMQIEDFKTWLLTWHNTRWEHAQQVIQEFNAAGEPVDHKKPEGVMLNSGGLPRHFGVERSFKDGGCIELTVPINKNSDIPVSFMEANAPVHSEPQLQLDVDRIARIAAETAIDEMRWQEMMKPKTKVIDGIGYPDEAFAVVGDYMDPGTWDLLMWENLAEEETVESVNTAIDKLPRINISTDDMWSVKSRLRRAFRKVNPKGDIPNIIA